MATEMRQGTNKVSIVGVLKEKNLKLLEKDGKKSIAGDLVIETGKNEEHKIKIWVNELKKDGKKNGAYSGINTVMNEYISLADDVENATKVSINGASFNANDFFLQGKTISTIDIKTMFVNRVKEGDFEAKAEFEVEIFYTGIKEETDKEGEETGRILVTGYNIAYGGKLIPMTFVASGEIADYIRENFEKGLTGTLAGDLINTVERTVTKKEGFGKAREEVFTKVKREFLITGGDDQLDEDDEKAYNIKDIKEAIKERDAYLESLKNQDNKKETKKKERKKADDEFPF